MTHFYEAEHAVLVWMNPEAAHKPQKRLLETLTTRNSLAPLVLPIRTLQLTVQNPVPATADTLQDRILSSSKQNPLIVPLPLAKSHLGWTEFDIFNPDEE